MGHRALIPSWGGSDHCLHRARVLELTEPLHWPRCSCLFFFVFGEGRGQIQGTVKMTLGRVSQRSEPRMNRSGWGWGSVSPGVHLLQGTAGKGAEAGKSSPGSLWQRLARAGKASLGVREWPSQERPWEGCMEVDRSIGLCAVESEVGNGQTNSRSVARNLSNIFRQEMPRV